MICQLYDSWYRENCINMLSEQNTAMNWNISLMTACIIVPECKIKVLKHLKLYKDAYILQESFTMTDKSYPPPCRNYLQPLYLSVTLYACAQREYLMMSDFYNFLSMRCLLCTDDWNDFGPYEKSKIEKVPRYIQGESREKDMASSVKLVSTIGA